MVDLEARHTELGIGVEYVGLVDNNHPFRCISHRHRCQSQGIDKRTQNHFGHNMHWAGGLQEVELKNLRLR